MAVLEKVQRKETAAIKGMQGFLHKEQLKGLRLFSEWRRRWMGDTTEAYKITKAADEADEDLGC